MSLYLFDDGSVNVLSPDEDVGGVGGSTVAVNNPIPNQVVLNGNEFTYLVPSATFSGPTVELTSTLSNGQALSTVGLAFDGQRFSGTIANNSTVEIRVRATNIADSTDFVDDFFSLVSLVTAPQQFTFNDITAAPLNSGPNRGVAAILGVTAGETLTVTNGELSNDGGITWSSGSLQMVTGLTFVRSNAVTASSSYSTTVSAPETTVNGVSDTFSVRTLTTPLSIGSIDTRPPDTDNADTYDSAEAITPDDTTGFGIGVCTAIWVGTGGDVTIETLRLGPITFSNVPSGYMLRVVARRVNSTGTTASQMVALK